MEKKYTNRNFEIELNRFMRAMMNAEEEKGFLSFLRKNKTYAKKAYLSAVIVKEVRRNAAETDKRIINKIQK